MKTQTLLIDNLIISYHSFIGTNQRILLFLHGRGRDKEDWKSYFSTLEKNQISFFAVDFPGLGGSQLPPTLRGVKEYSEFVLQFLEKMNITSAVEIIAQSMGGRMAFYLTAYHPKRVKKLWLIAPAGVEKTISPIKKFFFRIGKKILPQCIQRYVSKHIHSVDYQNAGKLQSIFKKIVSQDLRDLFPQITQPVTLYRGENDDQIEKWQIEIMRQSLPHLTFTAFPNTTHDAHKEQADRILSDILAA